MDNVVDFAKKRRETKNGWGDGTSSDKPGSLIVCPKCNDMLFMAIIFADTPDDDVEDGGPFGLVCQHCSYSPGVVFLYPEEEIHYTDVVPPESTPEKKQTTVKSEDKNEEDEDND